MDHSCVWFKRGRSCTLIHIPAYHTNPQPPTNPPEKIHGPKKTKNKHAHTRTHTNSRTDPHRKAKGFGKIGITNSGLVVLNMPASSSLPGALFFLIERNVAPTKPTPPFSVGISPSPTTKSIDGVILGRKPILEER